MDTTPTADHRPGDHPLRWRGLRYLLLDELRRRPQMSVAELVAALSEAGFTFEGRPSKVISDSLRWEIRAGRVERLSRGVYRYRPTPYSTMRRVTLLAERSRRWLEAVGRGDPPPPTPAEQRPGVLDRDPGRPPWAHLGWVWTR